MTIAEQLPASLDRARAEAIAQLGPADRELWDAMGEATPSFTTWPTAGACHDLGACLVVARTLGTPLMPWQRWAIRIVTERRLDDPSRFRFPLFLLTVPRQAGKTTVLRVILTQRASMMPGRRAFYTAQTGKDATARWKDLADAIAAGPLGPYVQLRKAIGSQSLTFPNGSSISPFAPTPKSLHGYTPHDVMIDEIFAFLQAQGDDLLGAVGPAQITLPDRQLGLVSTAGNAESTFLRGQLELARQSLQEPGSLRALLEWSQPEHLDPHNPEHWGFHPALGHTATLQDLIDLHEQHRDTPGEWIRAFMNRWTTTREAIIPEAVLRATFTEQTPPPSVAELRLAYEVAADRTRSVIWAAWWDPATGRPALRLVQSGTGADWLPAAVAQLAADWQPAAVGADDGGPTRDATDRLRQLLPEHVELQVLSARDFATACDSWKAQVEDSQLSLDGSAGLIDSVAGAARRSMQQGWAWDRIKSAGPIPDLIASTVALRLLQHGPQLAPDPIVRFS